jgi:hypothetical protein
MTRARRHPDAIAWLVTGLILVAVAGLVAAVLLAVDALWPERQTRPYPPEGDDGLPPADVWLVTG